MASNVNRRNVLKQVLTGSAALAAGAVLPTSVLASVNEKYTADKLKGNINHSVCRWCYSDMPLENLCKVVNEIGFGAIDLLKPNEWPTAKKYGLDVSMCYTAGETSLTKGWNDLKNHDWLIKDYLDGIQLVAEAGYKNLICFVNHHNFYNI